MAGHNKWSKIKRKKAKKDKKRSKVFGKLVEKIQTEAKRCGGDLQDPGLQQAIQEAKDADMPKDNIEDAIERATTEAEGSKEITYEMYGPGGVAMVIQTQTANRNKSAAEVRHIVTSAGYELAKPNAVVWAFEQERDDEGNVIWKPNNPVEVSDDDKKKVENLVEKLEENEEVAGVFTNVK